MLLYGSTEAATSTGSHDHEPLMINGDYMSPMTYASVQGANNSEKLSNDHLSNHSSLATSLGSSQEGSRDWTGLSTKFYATLTPLPPAMQPRPTVSAIQMAVFDAWNDG